jgi:hypothetical protein
MANLRIVGPLLLGSIAASSAGCLPPMPAGSYEAALREPIWNVDPVDPAELFELQAKNPAAFQARFERRIVRVRGRVAAVYDDSEVLRTERAWSARITSEGAPSAVRSLTCRLPSRSEAARISTDSIVVVHGVPEIGLGSGRLDGCVVETVGGNLPAAVPIDRVAVSPDFREELAVAARDLDAEFAAGGEAAAAKYAGRPLLVTGRVLAVRDGGAVHFETTSPVRILVCSDLAPGAATEGKTVTVRAKLKRTFFGGAYLWDCRSVAGL